MKPLPTLSFLTAIACVAAGGWFGRSVPFAEQWPLFEALRTTASIIFAVIGAWMAIIYPDRMKFAFATRSKRQNGKGEQSAGWSHLFQPVVNSTAILCLILVAGALAPILKRVDLGIPIECARGTSYAFLVALTLWQVWTVILTFIPADVIKTSIDQEVSKRDLLERRMARGSRVTDQSASIGD